MAHRLLVADPDPAVVEALSMFLQGRGFECTPADGAQAALRILGHSSFDVVLCDTELADRDGRDLASLVQERHPETPVLLLTTLEGPDAVLRAHRAGARDALSKPVHFEDLLLRLHRALSERDQGTQLDLLRRELRHSRNEVRLIGRSPKTRAVADLVEKLAPSTSTVLVTGESGTGKEVVARVLHQAGESTRNRRFVPVNCAAIPATLMESELFGHVRGAFTGAVSERRGLFEMAESGTLFLDEIGELDLGLQAKLLRAIDRKEIVRVGGVDPIRLNARIVCATNRDLQEQMARNLFREDLFYRISVVEIRLPPLRERPEDIPDLVAHFIGGLNREIKSGYRGVREEAMEALQAYAWKGNIRELRNVIERAMILGKGTTISIEDLPPHIAENPRARPRRLREALRAFERDHVRSALALAGGDRPKAARQLGIGVSSLYRKLRSLGLPDRPPPEDGGAPVPLPARPAGKGPGGNGGETGATRRRI